MFKFELFSVTSGYQWYEGTVWADSPAEAEAKAIARFGFEAAIARYC